VLTKPAKRATAPRIVAAQRSRKTFLLLYRALPPPLRVRRLRRPILTRSPFCIERLLYKTVVRTR
jgi:hypothetical protein